MESEFVKDRKLKILNLYAGIGGNRKLWGNEHTVVAIESDMAIAEVYSDLFPQDEVIISDAHRYLLEHFNEFDFIWSSPPCPSHSQLRYNMGFLANRTYAKVKPIYPDMKLYEEIILLQKWFKGLWCVENTIPYYKPLIPGTVTGGHIFWSNFAIKDIGKINRNHRGGTVETLSARKGFDLSKYKLKNKRQVLRNCVEPEVGKHILDSIKDGKG